MPETDPPRADPPAATPIKPAASNPWPVDPLPDLVPARMLNEFAYCPRLAYLEWVQGEFAESADTLDGTFQHRRVDRPGGAMPGPAVGGPAVGGPRGGEGARGRAGEGERPPREVIHSRSVHLSAPGVGLVAIIDLVEGVGDDDDDFPPMAGGGDGGGRPGGAAGSRDVAAAVVAAPPAGAPRAAAGGRTAGGAGAASGGAGGLRTGALAAARAAVAGAAGGTAGAAGAMAAAGTVSAGADGGVSAGGPGDVGAGVGAAKVVRESAADPVHDSSSPDGPLPSPPPEYREREKKGDGDGDGDGLETPIAGEVVPPFSGPHPATSPPRHPFTSSTPRRVVPVDYKRGRVPDVPGRAWEPERVQLCAQGLILRECGYACDRGVLYFVESRTRVTVRFDDALVARTLALLAQMRATAAGGRIPPPLVDSPKCPRCSLVGICLPDETRLLASGAVVPLTVLGERRGGEGESGGGGDEEDDEDVEEPRARMLIARAGDGRALYVTEPRAYVGKRGDVVEVRGPAGSGAGGSSGMGSGPRRPARGKKGAKGARAAGRGDGGGAPGDDVASGNAASGPSSSSSSSFDDRPVIARVRLAELSHVCLFGTPQVSTQLLHELCDRQVPVAYFSAGGYFRGLTTGLPSKNVELRIAQYRAADDPAARLAVARAIVAGKVENQRTLLRRNHPAPPPHALADLRRSADQAAATPAAESLLGVEGYAARVYFGAFAGMLKPRQFPAADADARDDGADAGGGGGTSRNGKPAAAFTFDFAGRNRRPPADPVNALLSLGYAVLARDLTAACWVAGLDPFLGFYHAPRYGRPALALDLMEEFRPLVVDSTVLTAVNTGAVAASDFVRRGPAVALKPDGRRRFLRAYERRMDGLVTHPVFGYRVSYRRALEVQARLLGRVLLGEVPGYVPFTTR